ncbi:hypothetical protein GCM10023310_44090 [Paenibacillus vulneris]|uniref:Glycoside hydrolase family 105 protein n=1 Tax=Paenibacillus vulneris TaxID=1133364 RepID=A0ABW3US14_9BACL
MSSYFHPIESMGSQTAGCDIPHVLAVMAQRYIGANPPHEPVYRVTRTNEIRKQDHHLYQFPVSSMFPEMNETERVYAWGKLWSEQPEDFIFHLRCYGPVRLYHNGVKRFGSAPEEEKGDSGTLPIKLKISLTRGWNHFVFELGKNAGGGCGAEFGTGNRKNKPFHFLAPSAERDGEEGWIYTAPLSFAIRSIPGGNQSEEETGAKWLPERETPHLQAGRLEQMYGLRPGATAYAWTAISNAASSVQRITVEGTAYGPVSFTLNGGKVLGVPQSGDFVLQFDAGPGKADLVAQCIAGEDGWGFEIRSLSAGASLTAPRRIHGYRGSWLYLGPFAPGTQVNVSDYLALDTVAYGEEGSLFWTTEQPGANIRPFLENELFGRWNYPLGVTLFGLLETSHVLQRTDLSDYVLKHVEFATSTYAYSLWDRERYGAAGLNNQLSHIDSLDDCGSFGALAILANRLRPLKGAPAVFDDIAHYIMDVQDRMPDGALYRHIGVSPSMHNTMWCDDMYMSVPFLCRYAEHTRDIRYIDEAARQLLLYKNYLFMPEQSIMSHVYDVNLGKRSQTAWGRGNGWVFFSLAVLLAVLPQDHAAYPDILSFYRELAEGYRRLQGVHGLWHQVLTDPESYEEASCTSMFMYGFALGVRHGWLEQPEPYIQAVLSGWQGLCERAIDKQGNLYGVCKGSSWSYHHAYYKHDLGWNLNDTHGIGIVLLAGIETQRMKEQLGITG